MSKEIFKVEDKVFDFKYGWGFVYDARCPIIVRFSEYTVSYAKKDLKTLSFTEYTLQGFSQERPIELPEVGEDVLVYDENSDDWILRQFERYVACSCIPFHVTDRDSFLSTPRGYSKLKRIKIL